MNPRPRLTTLRHILTSLTLASALLLAACGAPDQGEPGSTAADPDQQWGKADSLLAQRLGAYSRYIEHRSTIKVGAQVYTHLKLNYGKGKLATLVLDRYGKAVAPSAVKGAISAQYKAYGKIHPALWRARSKSYNADHPVLIWLDLPPLQIINKPTRTISSIKDTLASLAKVHAKNLASFRQAKAAAIKQLGLYNSELVRDVPEAPFVVARLRGQRIGQLAGLKQVRSLLRADPKGIDDVSDSLAVSGADDVIAAGTTGDDVRVAVWENRPTSTAGLGIVNSYTAAEGIAATTSDHAENVSGIVRAYAPDAALYSADSKDLAALDWAIDTIRVSAINQSFHRSDEIDDSMSSDDLYKDYKVLHYPWPFISHAAGNWCGVGSSCYESGSDVTDEHVNHKGYNTISVGNHDDTAATMRASSCFINPTSPHGDRELPEIAANGVGVTARGITMSGTSQASPAVVGSAALLQETAPILKIWPEGVRALLFAGATHNIATHDGQLAGGGDAADAPNTWWADLSAGRDGFDGAGGLNVQESVRIAGNRYRGAAASRGWDIGKLTSTSFASDGFHNKSYKIKVPTLTKLPTATTGAGKISWPALKRRVRVALAWDSTVMSIQLPFISDIYLSLLQLDLDIRVFDSKGHQVATSLSWDNSYEVADFLGTPGETYTVRVHRWASSSSSSAWSWFGIAWGAR